MSIGFHPQSSPIRIPYFDVSGNRLGYVQTRNGTDYALRNDGTVIAKIIRYNNRYVRHPDANIHASAMIFPQFF